MISYQSVNSSLSDLKALEPEPPEGAGTHWKGVKHYDLIQSLMAQCKRLGHPCKRVQVALMRGGADMDAGLDFVGPEGWDLSLGVGTSNARRRLLTFFVGGVHRETDCPLVTHCFPGDKYTLNFDLDRQCESAARTWCELSKDVVKEHVRELQANRISNATFDTLLMHAGRTKIMPWSRCGKMDSAWRRSANRTALDLVLLFGRLAGFNPPDEQMKQCHLFYQAVSEVVAGRKAA